MGVQLSWVNLLSDRGHWWLKRVYVTNVVIVSVMNVSYKSAGSHPTLSWSQGFVPFLMGGNRLLHSPHQEAVGPSVGYDTWPQLTGVTGWLADSNVDMGTPHLHWVYDKMQCIMGSLDLGIPTIFRRPLTVPTHSQLTISGMHRDCERV